MEEFIAWNGGKKPSTNYTEHNIWLTYLLRHFVLYIVPTISPLHTNFSGGSRSTDAQLHTAIHNTVIKINSDTHCQYLPDWYP
ncbi:hypothetical protein DAKH74_046480 [Maudiozyma humilis]|uniref:Uncharacterized protein n=1 Tax=Maudiozyma humilis TaxID=51915 RepID=A0AAV5S453_MAUHU|nr:hypothetical protein DAKH74_046480 [Kazachstania humilis]